MASAASGTTTSGGKRLLSGLFSEAGDFTRDSEMDSLSHIDDRPRWIWLVVVSR